MKLDQLNRRSAVVIQSSGVLALLLRRAGHHGSEAIAHPYSRIAPLHWPLDYAEIESAMIAQRDEALWHA